MIEIKKGDKQTTEEYRERVLERWAARPQGGAYEEFVRLPDCAQECPHPEWEGVWVNKFLILLSLLFFACENETKTVDIWIDAQCNEKDIERIYLATSALNAAIPPSTVDLNIAGTKIYDHSRWKLNDTDTIACYYEKPDWEHKWDEHYGAGHLGAAIPEREIKLFFYKMTNTFRAPHVKTWLIRHELLHYIWVRDHTKDPNSVLCGKNKKGCNFPIDYNQSDIDLFCTVYDC